MAYVLLLPAVLVLLWLAVRPLFGTPEDDEWCSRVDQALDRERG